MPSEFTREVLTVAVAESTSWAGLMRRLGVTASGGRRRTLQRTVADYGIDTSHFQQRSPWRKYPDERIAEAVASSTTLREVVEKLGARPATGTLSHIRRRIAAAGIDVSHFPALNRRPLDDLPFSSDELRAAATTVNSLRAMARILGVSDDGRSRAVLRRMLRDFDIDVSHFSHARIAVPDNQLRSAVAGSTSYADVLRTLGLPLDDANYRRIQRRTVRLGLDTTHFSRQSRRPSQVVPLQPVAAKVLRVHTEGSGRINRDRLHRALQEIGLPYRCAFCGNPGEWRDQPITLQIDHINGDWLDNRAENLRYLCPNCHAITDTWCRRVPRRARPAAE